MHQEINLTSELDEVVLEDIPLRLTATRASSASSSKARASWLKYQVRLRGRLKSLIYYIIAGLNPPPLPNPLPIGYGVHTSC